MMHGVAKPPSILERPVYGVSEAAGLLGLRPHRARAWLDGYERSGVRYPTVIREEPTGEDQVTWASSSSGCTYARVCLSSNCQTTADSQANIGRHSPTIELTVECEPAAPGCGR